MTVTLFHGDCLGVMPTLEENSIDAIVCDPPYGLSFMGKDWDHGVPGISFWKAALRVAKPGAHLLAFGGTRTFHRLAVAIEDAGWEIRDTVMWVYGSGFPKSHDVSKAIDKQAGAEREVVGNNPNNRPNGDAQNSMYANGNGTQHAEFITAPATLEAAQWAGWGTALKPSWEPIILARKPFAERTVAANVLEWGTGAINVDGCRVGTDGGGWNGLGDTHDETQWRLNNPDGIQRSTAGRWPANLIHDGSDEVMELFPQSNRWFSAPRAVGKSGKSTTGTSFTKHTGNGIGFDDTGSASRFFYCAKASKADRDGSTHPTVKPSSLMRYLCRLVTPSKGVILDPFMGSGSTGKAAVLECFSFVGIDQKVEYVDDARVRIENAQKQVDAASQQLSFSIEIE